MKLNFSVARILKSGLLTSAILYVFFLLRQGSKQSQLKGASVKEAPLAKSNSHWLLYWLIGHAADFKPWKCSLGMVSTTFLNERFRWYQTVSNKEAVRVKIFGDNTVFLKDHGTIEAMIGKEMNHFRNSDTIRTSWGNLFPNGVVVLTGEPWKRVRKALSRAIYKVDLPALPASTGRCMDRGIPDLIPGDSTEIFVWETFAKLTLDSFINFTFGYPLNAMNGNKEALDLLEMLKDLVSMIADRMLVNVPLLWHLPFGYTPKMFRYRDILESYIDEKIDARMEVFRSDPEGFREKAGSTILDALILAVEELQTVSREEIRAQLVAMLFGGFDTTTSSLSFLFKLLCENPEYQDKLYEEVKGIDLQTFSKQELDDLPYLNSIVRESQRLHSVAPLLPRVPNSDVVINKTLFKKDTNILIDGHSLCREPKHWDGAQDLDMFRPERWFDFSPAPGVFNPFGFGARQCIGYRIGYAQLQTILLYLNQRFIFKPSGKPIKVCFNLGFTVTNDATFIVERRSPVEKQ